MSETLNPGLNYDSSWKPPPVDASRLPIERLADTQYHGQLLTYFTTRLRASEERMNQFYSRWRANERKMQAYIDLPDYERILEQMNKEKKPPSPVSITFPYAYANVWTVVTYHLHTFCGRKPIFQVGAVKAESIASAQNMEKLLQWNADATRLTRYIFNFLMDGQIYGVGILRTLWKVKKSLRTIWVPQQGLMGMLAQARGQSGKIKQKVEKVVFEGNQVESIDPFMFFPDPNVPMAEVNRRGEYVFWRTFVGKHELLAAEGDGTLRYINKCSPVAPGSRFDSQGESVRSNWIGGNSFAGASGAQRQLPYYQFDQGSVMIIPRELGLSDSTRPERWLVGIINKTQIVQLEPLDVEHDMHPVAVIEPNTQGYGFGQASLIDYIGPIQDTMSWLLNSHIHNVRGVLNNSFIYDPSMIEQQDLKNPEPGKLIRLKRSAIGQDVRSAIQQLPVQDVTGQHIGDLQVFQKTADIISGVSDNIRGIQSPGGRATATEVRTSAESGASRLAAQARLISNQGMVDLTEQMTVNLQANLSQEVYLSVLGKDGMDAPVSIGPETIMGDFYYPTNDGTLPLDRVALLDVWKELLMGVAQSPQLSQSYSLPKLFEFVAKLGGAENIESFKAQVAPEPGPNQVPVGSMQ